MQLEVKHSPSPEGIAKKGVFRRAWNHLTDWSESPVLNKMAERHIRKGKYWKAANIGIGAVPAIADVLEHEDAQARTHAASAIRTVMMKHPGHDWGRVIGLLIAASKDSDANLGHYAASALRQLGLDKLERLEDRVRCLTILYEKERIVEIGVEAVPTLLELLGEGHLRQYASSSIFAIIDSHPEHDWAYAIRPLMEALKKGDRDLCRDAANLLEKIGFGKIVDMDDRVICMLVSGKTDNAFEVGLPAIPALVGALGIENKFVQMNAARTLGGMAMRYPDIDGWKSNWEHTISALLVALKDEDPWVREEAARTLSTMMEKNSNCNWANCINGFLDALKDGNANVRRSIILAIGRMAGVGGAGVPEWGAGAIPVLIAAVKDPDSLVRTVAIESLLSILGKHPEYGWEKALPVLVEALFDQSENIRSRASQAVEKIAKAKPDYDWTGYIPSLILALSGDVLVRRNAGSALREIAERRPNDVALAIVDYVNGKGGDMLAITDAKTEEMFMVLHTLMLRCGEAMKDAA